MHHWTELLLAFAGAHPQLLGLIACVAAFTEAIVVVGAVVPGTAIVLAVSGLAGATNLPLWPLVLWTTLGAALGDGSAYLVGRHYGGALTRRWPFSTHPQILEKGSAFFRRHGGKSVFFGRFVPGVKAIVPVVAGMLEMPLPGFLVANLSSGLIWAAAHVIVAAVAGVVLASIGAVSGRLVGALAGAVVALLVAFWLARLLVMRAAPWAALAYRGSVARLAGSRFRLARRAADALSPANPHLLGTVGWSALFVLAAVGLMGVIEDILNADPLVQADASISHLVQSIRTEPLDRVMVAVTALGDSVVITVAVVALLAALALARQFRSALAVAAAFVLASAAVPLIKLALHRQRPIELYTGAELFAFPSGHTTFSTLLLATIAMLIAPRLKLGGQVALWTAALFGVAAIGTSRIYLGAHWPSDVFGGVLVGTLISCALALILTFKTRIGDAGWWCGAATAFVFLAFGLVHGELSAAGSLVRYAHVATPATMAESAWLSGGWKDLPEHRVDLLGETEEPLFLQYAGPLSEITDRLAEGGWQRPETASPKTYLRLISATAKLDTVPPLPLLHKGAWPGLTMVKPDGSAGSRLVLRLWPSGHDVTGGAGDAPLWLGSLTVETITHPYRALSTLRDEGASPEAMQAIEMLLGGSPGLTSARRTSEGGREALLVVAESGGKPAASAPSSSAGSAATSGEAGAAPNPP